MTLEQFRRTIGRKTGMDYGSAGVDRDLIDSWINEGVREVLIRTYCYVAAADVQTTIDEWQYDLSQNVMVIKNLWRDGGDRMERVSAEELIDLRRTSGSGSSSTLRWAFEGANMLLLWPTPTAVYDLDFLYVPRPTEMSFDSHDPSNATYGGVPVELHKGIELWALANASDHEHETTTQRGISYLAQFDEWVRRVARPYMNRRAGDLPRARVGRRALIPSRNDTYPR